MTHEDYLSLCRLIWHHNKCYFVEHTPEIGDEEFDRLMHKLLEMERLHPEWIHPSSPTQKGNEALTAGFSTVKHAIPMLSLANVYSVEELRDFFARVEKLASGRPLSYAAELKMDGIAISCRYEKGFFVRGATRGNGVEGDEITANLRGLKQLPLKLKGEEIPDILELRGEVFMPREVFQHLNQEREFKGEPLWANPRNAAAGSLKLLDPAESARRKLDIVFYGVAEGAPFLQSQYAVHAYMKALGLPVLKKVAYCKVFEEVMAFVTEVEQMRSALPFEIDGVVVKVDELAEQQRLGSTGKNPRGAVAFKFAASQAVTRLLGITVQIGRTGVLTPVAELEPILLAGSTISRATLHNAEEVKRKDIRIGDWVMIEKGGDVIPKVVHVVHDRRLSEAQPWSPPTHCPSCGSPVTQHETEVALRCPNSADCPAQKLKRLIFFAGKEALDIENLGEKVMAQLVSKGFVKEPADLFRLTAEQLSQVEGFKEKSVHNLLKSLEAARHVTLARLIMSLGIRHVGKETADALARFFSSIEAFQRASQDQLLKIEGIGGIVAAAVDDFLRDPSHQKELQALLESGLIVAPVAQAQEGHSFAGKSFVLTGTLASMSRDEAADKIKERGGKVLAALSRKTDYLVVGAEAGSKLQKAQTLGVALLDEGQFLSML